MYRIIFYGFTVHMMNEKIKKNSHGDEESRQWSEESIKSCTVWYLWDRGHVKPKKMTAMVNKPQEMEILETETFMAGARDLWDRKHSHRRFLWLPISEDYHIFV